MKTIYNITNTGKLIALTSFVLGTCLLITFLLFPKENKIIITGLYYVGYTAIANTILLIILIIMACIHWNYKRIILKTCGLLLLNIPIAIGYFFIVINFI